MSKPPQIDVSDLPLDDLLSGLGDRNFRRESIIELWLKSAGYRPSTECVKASVLYEIFADWYRVRPELSTYPCPTPQHFGSEMGRRFRKERKPAGYYYFLSRESVSDIPPSLELGGGGNPGGPTPGGPKSRRKQKDK